MTEIPSTTVHRRTARLRRTTAAATVLAALIAASACAADDSRAVAAQVATESARTTPPHGHADLERTLTRILEEHRADHQFVGAVLTMREANGTTVTATSGTRSPGADSRPVDPDVPWNMGSVTKTFVAVVVLQLAEEGRIDLDAGMDEFLPDLPAADRITPRQLLQHTSGLGEYLDQPAVLADAQRKWTPAELIAVAEVAGRKGEPGGPHAYSNTNFIVLGEIIEHVTGNPWDDEVRRRILEPLDMCDTAMGTLPGAPGYGLEGEKFVDYTDRWDPSVGGSAGGLVSTAADLLMFTEALADGSLLSERSQEQMSQFIPAEDLSQFGVVRHGYGLGLEEYATEQVTAVGHMGSGAAHASFIGFDRESGAAVAVMTNTAEPAGPPALVALEALAAVSR